MSKCNCRHNCCAPIQDCGCQNECRKDDCCGPSCGCAKPIFEIEEMPESVATLRFNNNGVSAWYNYQNMIYQTQTDTNLSIDTVKRILNYMAERHVDQISAQELGAMLHIADIGDVDIKGIADNAMFVYQKNSDCGEGCEGINNSWVAWNALEHQNTTLDSIMGFDANGKQYSLQKPTDTSKHYLIGWDAQNKIRYITPTAFGSLTGKKPLYIDPSTGEIGYGA